MSSEELLVAYSEGQISRRALMRRLVAAGVSVGAAATYAHVLAPRAEAESNDALKFTYPTMNISLLSTKLAPVVARRRVKVRVRADRAGTYKVGVLLVTKTYPYKRLGFSKPFHLDKDQSKQMRVRIRTKRLKTRKAAKIFVELGWDRPGPLGFGYLASDTKKLT